MSLRHTNDLREAGVSFEINMELLLRLNVSQVQVVKSCWFQTQINHCEALETERLSSIFSSHKTMNCSLPLKSGNQKIKKNSKLYYVVD